MVCASSGVTRKILCYRRVTLKGLSFSPDVLGIRPRPGKKERKSWISISNGTWTGHAHSSHGGSGISSGLVSADNYPRPRTQGQVVPRPFEHHASAIAKSDEKKDMHH